MKATALISGAIALSAFAAPAFAQSAPDDWTGGYVGGHLGSAFDPSDSSSDRFLFDTDLDGNYDDTVRTPAGDDAFAPGFCNGAANGATPDQGCRGNSGGADWGVRGGYDWQSGGMVYGLVAEYSMNDVRDAVTAFSVTPAYYTMIRKIDGMFALRGRIGFAFGDASENLLYATAGGAWARIDNTHETSNGVNTFVDSGGETANGYQVGLGYERRINRNFSIGAEYLYTDLRADDFRVRAQGPAPAANPFILENPSGTDMRRANGDFKFDSVRLTAAWRF